MKKILVASLALLSLSAFAQQTVWNMDKSHSSIKFAVAHLMISEVEGKFDEFALDAKADKPDFSDAVVKVTIPVKSINTDDAKRDEHLRSPDFFDTGKFPEIVIEDVKLKTTKKAQKVTAKVTMRGVTKDVQWDAKVSAPTKDPWGKTRVGVKITGKINRQDFGVKYNSVLDNGGVAVGNEVAVTGNFELVKVEAEAK